MLTQGNSSPCFTPAEMASSGNPLQRSNAKQHRSSPILPNYCSFDKTVKGKYTGTVTPLYPRVQSIQSQPTWMTGISFLSLHPGQHRMMATGIASMGYQVLQDRALKNSRSHWRNRRTVKKLTLCGGPSHSKKTRESLTCSYLSFKGTPIPCPG